MGGCGSHIFLDLFRNARMARVIEPLVLLQAMVLARKDAAAPCRLDGYSQHTAAQTVVLLSKQLSVTPPAYLMSDEDCFQCFGDAIKNIGSDRMYVVHHYDLSHSNPVIDQNGDETFWTTEDRDATQDMLDRAVAYLGIDMPQAAVVRNPVDIYYSKVERFNNGAMKEIGEFFSMLVEKVQTTSLPVVRYEDVCRAHGDKLEDLLSQLHFTPEDIERLNTSVIHGGNLDKWRLYPPRKVTTLANTFREYMKPFGYQVRPHSRIIHVVRWLSYRLPKYRAEFKIINHLLAGDFSIDNSFSRHSRSIPARIWFRLRLLSPSARRNLRHYYQTYKEMNDIPTRSLRVVMREVLGL